MPAREPNRRAPVKPAWPEGRPADRYAAGVPSVPTSRQDDADALRARYPTLVYRACSAERAGDAVTFAAELATVGPDAPELAFRPQVTVEGVGGDHPAEVLELIAFHLGLAELPSYWKATCSPEIVVVAGPMTAAQLDWLHTLLLNGMGEYFYVNGIDHTAPGFVSVRARAEAGGPGPDGRERDLGSVLVPVSGGKDSVVAWQALRAAGLDPVAMTLNPTRAAEAVLAVMSPRRVVRARRRIDPRLLALNAAGYLNGHTPFSAYLAVLGTACAMLAGLGRVAMSNERSAEEANVTWLGRPVNHQWSKSLAFERGFRADAARHLATGVDYFSLLRPLYELQISAGFAAERPYHRAFRSCNRGQAAGVWCGACPKCLGVCALLAPFLDGEELAGIFGRELLADEGLAPLAVQLLTPDAKPFECVGTHEETLAAFHLAAGRARAAGRPLPPLLALVAERVLAREDDLDARAAAVLDAWTDAHEVPGELVAAVRAAAGLVAGAPGRRTGP
jgi:UDP-N-acetyl-alpha-D-muramoyl-L-alanyl-L-glutamate epimerase